MKRVFLCFLFVWVCLCVTRVYARLPSVYPIAPFPTPERQCLTLQVSTRACSSITIIWWDSRGEMHEDERHTDDSLRTVWCVDDLSQVDELGYACEYQVMLGLITIPKTIHSPDCTAPRQTWVVDGDCARRVRASCARR
jgi:hypothetical protein